ncbi:MAG TPA: VacJ family lipoprotein [Steroidobacteraceae bacterium]|jgi:phospholipid-binding lipoprotein MlaA|nr:VacJ family lipoprotein [Steroidobacteraceae bacterium]
MTQCSPAALARGLILVCAWLAGCASQPITHKDPRDPFERVNRATFKFNDAVVQKIAKPVGHTYNRVVPKFMRIGLSNFIDNTQTPEIIINDLLQAKFKAGLTDIGRFLLNSTVGVGGLLDPATAAGMPKDDNDFGRTLGTWGIHPGPFLMLPLLGPSDIRDVVGKVPDGYLWPVNYIKNRPVYYGFYALYILDTNVRTVLPSYQLLESQNAYDPYALMRNVYLQRRDFLIHGQSSKAEENQEQELEKSLEESGPDETPAETPKKQP